jgi:hypothetical protein
MAQGKRSQVLNCALVRKRCKCGKQVKAIQLTRYGACDACVAKATAARAAKGSKAADA